MNDMESFGNPEKFVPGSGPVYSPPEFQLFGAGSGNQTPPSKKPGGDGSGHGTEENLSIDPNFDTM